MSIQHSRSKVVPSLWQSVFDREFAQVERMFMPGALYEIMPLSARPFFSPPLPESGVFGVGDTIEYFKTIRDKLLSDATKASPRPSSVVSPCLARADPDPHPSPLALVAGLRAQGHVAGRELAHGALRDAGSRRQGPVRRVAHALPRV